MSALTKAKTYLQFSDPTTLDSAEEPATKEFKAKYSRWRRLSLMPDTFTSTNIEQYNSSQCYVYFDNAIIRKMYTFFELSTDDEDYADNYEVLSIDESSNRVLLDMIFVEGVTEIEFNNTEKDIYETALAWYICSFGRYTNQQIVSGDFLVTSTQIGNGNITTSPVLDLNSFRMSLITRGDDLLRTKELQWL